MSYYKVCSYCGCNLDPGERCDCKEKAVASVRSTDNGKAGSGFTPHFSASMITKNIGGFKYVQGKIV